MPKFWPEPSYMPFCMYEQDWTFCTGSLEPLLLAYALSLKISCAAMYYNNRYANCLKHSATLCNSVLNNVTCTTARKKVYRIIPEFRILRLTFHRKLT